jgi:fructose-1,6-bisphosphatase/inositol monophosphatase family enzyme
MSSPNHSHLAKYNLLTSFALLCSVVGAATFLSKRGKKEGNGKSVCRRSKTTNDDCCDSSPCDKSDGIYEIPSQLLQSDNLLKRELELAVKVALEAGQNMIPHLQSKGTQHGAQTESSLNISSKSNDADFCTAIDIQNEALIIKAIKETFPDHDIIGEEDTGVGKIAALSATKPTWIIDPVDGTTNFASGHPLTCVSIGLCMNGKPTLGVVYAPATQELYIAVTGYGAYRNGQRIFANSSSMNGDGRNTLSLSRSVVCFEFGSTRSKEGIEKMTSAVKRILSHGCRATRSYGSGVLDLVYVASGRLDIVYTGVDEEGWKPWDYCAGMVVVTEAGCVIEELITSCTDDSRKPFNIYAKSMICGVHEKLVEECRRIILDE